MLVIWDFLCFFISIAVILHGMKYAKVWRLLDNPSHERKKHTSPTPMVGGLALYSAFLFSFVYSYAIGSVIPFYFMLSMSIIFIVGVLDDRAGVSAYKRLLIQFSVAIYMLYNDPQLYLGVLSFLPFEHGAFEYTIEIVAAFFIVGSINAFNLIDGIDGLAGSLALVSLLSVAYLSYTPLYSIFLMAIFLSISIAAYLCFNLELFGTSKKIFFGDSGSTLLGLALSWMVLKLIGHADIHIEPVSGLFLILIPILDTLLVIGRRVAMGVSPFRPDRMHMHHMLIDIGFSKGQAVLVLGGISLIFAALAMLKLSTLFHVIFLMIFLSLYLTVLVILSSNKKMLLLER